MNIEIRIIAPSNFKLGKNFTWGFCFFCQPLPVPWTTPEIFYYFQIPRNSLNYQVFRLAALRSQNKPCFGETKDVACVAPKRTAFMQPSELLTVLITLRNEYADFYFNYLLVTLYIRRNMFLNTQQTELKLTWDRLSVNIWQ